MVILRCISLQISLFTIIFVLVISHTIQLSNSNFQDCSTLYNCGSIRNLGYPFYGENRPYECGSSGFDLFCLNDQETLIWIDKLQYIVLGTDESIPKMTLVRRDLFTNTCPVFIRNTTLPMFRAMILGGNVRNLNIFYGCTSEVIRDVQIKSNVTCSVDGDGDGVFFAHESVSIDGGCKYSIVVQMLVQAYHDLWHQKITLETALRQGFDVVYYDNLAACSSCERLQAENVDQIIVTSFAFVHISPILWSAQKEVERAVC